MQRNRRPSRFMGLVTLLLAVCVVALGALTFITAQKVSDLKGEVKEMQKTVAEIHQNTTALSSTVEILNNNVTFLTSSVFGSSADAAAEEADAAAGPEPAPEEETMESQGTLSPPSGSTDSAFNKVQDSSLEELMTQIQNGIPQGNGSWGCYVCDLSQGTEGFFSPGQPMQAASLIKLFIMGAVYEKYDTLAATYGAASLDGLLQPMITVSDNEAANQLVNYLGGGDSGAGMAAVNSFCLEHGYNGTSMGRLLLAPKDHGDNFTTVEDCGHFLREIYEVCAGTKTDSTLAHCDSMFNLLKQQTRRNKIPAQMPAGVMVANKTGELGDVENDAGIIYDTGKTDCVIVFMSENLSAAGQAQGTISSSSLGIYNYFNE